MTDEMFGDWIERFERKLDKITEDISAVRERTASLEVKAGFFGMIGGMLAILSTRLLDILP